MFVSPRFADIFSSRPVRTRVSDKSVTQIDSRAASDQRGEAVDSEAIWLGITAAHRRAYRSFTPELVRAAELATDEDGSQG